MDETLTLPILVNSSSVREMVNDKTTIKFHNINSNNNDLCNDTIKYKEHTMDSSITQAKDIPMMNDDENENYKRRWGIPAECRLLGGGETTINSNNPGWNSSSPNASAVNAQNTPNNSNNQNTSSPALSSNTNNAWSSGRPSTANTNQSSSNASHQTTTPQTTGKGGNNAGNQNSTNSQNQQAQQQVTTAGTNPTSWAQAAGKNLATASPASPGNSNVAPASPGNNGSGSSNGNGGNNGNGTPSAKQQIDQINTMREAIYSAEGWGGQHVNQDSGWDVPTSPEPSTVVKEGNPPTSFPFKPNVNNGTDLWEANLRNGGQPPPQPTQKAPWGHTPTNNIGGTWGEDDDVETSNVWTGTPNTNTNPSVQQWGNVPNAGGQMWGGNKKDEWGNVGNSWNDPRDMSRGGNGMDSRSNMVDGSHMRNVIDPHRNLTNEMMRAAPGGGITGRLNGSVDPMWGPPPQQQSGPAPHHHLTQGGPPNVPPVSSKLGPQGQSGSHWKDMTGGNNLGRAGMQCMPGPNMPQNRIAPGNGLNNSAGGPGVMKQDQQLWGHPAARNGAWGDGSHDVGPWGDDKMTPWNDQSWAGQKTKNIMAGGGWGDGEVDSSWNHPSKLGQKALTKEIIWASKQFRILTEMNFKKEDVEIALRASNMVVEDALEYLNSGRNENWRRPNDMDPNLFDHNARYNQGQQMFTVQQGLRGLQANQPTPQQLRVLVQQIQIAVQTGYLNHQILNQPLAPPTLLLLTQLLQQIKILQQLGHQYNVLQGQLPIGSKSSSTAMMNLSQQMQNIKKQIAQLQQAMLMKQQQSQHNINTMQHQQQMNVADYFKNQDQLSLIPSFNELSMSKEQQMAGAFQGQQSRLNQWKLPSLEKEELGAGNEFSRAPGSTPKSANSGTGSPNLNPLLGQGDGTWSNATGRCESGWPDALSESEGKDWPGQGVTNTNFTDLVPEFEPGKPWKGSQLKNIEDDPTITPGSVVRSPLSLAAIKDPENIFSQSQTGGGKTSPSNVEIPLASSTWAFNPSSAASFTSPLSKLNNTANITNKATAWTDTNDLWGVTKARGPPPGLTNKNTTAITSNGWSGLSSPRWPNNNPSAQSWIGSSWLMLRNLTPQIDASTLKTLCVQHGPVQSFHISLNHGVAFAKYSTREEASKAQNALNNCMLGNTTIFVESPSESDVHALLQQVGGSQMNAGNNNWAVRGGVESGINVGNNAPDTWGTAAGGNNASQLWPSTFWGGPSTPIIENTDAHRTTPSSLNSFLPGDLLGGEPI